MAEREFRKELESVINRHSMENGSDTPDFLLAEYLTAQLNLWDQFVTRREQWYGRKPRETMGNAVDDPIGAT